jgi:SAM-dependent methyltransferase
VDPGYAAVYGKLYERHWWWRARERFLLDRLQADVERAPNRRILDVGCGDALFFDELSAFGRVEGVEPDGDILSDGRWRTAIHVGTLSSFTPEVAYDWILMLDVLEHLPDAHSTLRRARELAGKDASLFVTVPAFQSLWTRHDDLNHHHARYTRSSLEPLLAGTGWQGVEWRYLFHWLAPVKLLVKLKEMLLTGDPEIERVPPPPLNLLAYSVSMLEQHLLSGLRIPFGTSLYVKCARDDAR